MKQPTWELQVEGHFDAAHHLNGYEGACANIHGHRWVVRTQWRAVKLDGIGMACDFKELKAELKGILDQLDHSDLNDPDEAAISVFGLGGNPTAENLAQLIYRVLIDAPEVSNLHLEGVELVYVTVIESPGCEVRYSEREIANELV